MGKMRNKKRLLAVALSFLMTLSLLSGLGTSVYAVPPTDIAKNINTNTTYWDVATALNSADSGETIVLLADVQLEDNITYNRSGMSVTLDLNNHTLLRNVNGMSGEIETASVIFVQEGTLTIQDTSDQQNGYIKYENTFSGGSGANVGANGTLKLLSGGIMGAGQGVYVHDAGAHFEMSGGVVYGYFDAPGSEALDAGNGAYVTVSGGYLGTNSQSAAMIWSGGDLDPSFWKITGGYFTSNMYTDSSPKYISNFVPLGEVTELNPTLKHVISGDTEYKYKLTTPKEITFDANGGSVDLESTTTTTDLTGKLSSLPNATKGNEAFLGWYTAPTGGTRITTNYIFTHDSIIYAQYGLPLEKENVPGAHINYYDEVLQGLVPNTAYLINDTVVTADETGNIKINPNWLGQNISIIKQGTPDVTLDSNPQSLNVPARPTAPLVGKTDEQGVNSKNGTLTQVSNTMEYRLKGANHWTAISKNVVTGLAPDSYEVRYVANGEAFASESREVQILPFYSATLHTNGGVINSGNVTGYNQGIAVTLPSDVTRSDAVFTGWYENSDFSGEAVSQIGLSDEGPVHLYAKWAYQVTFIYNDHDRGVYTIQEDIGPQELVHYPEPPTREGYYFVGWYKDTKGTQPWHINEVITSNLKLYARWESSAYSITGNVVDDTTPSPMNVTGATVKVFQGNVQYGITALTDSNGHFELTGVPNGVYNLVVSKGDQMITVVVTVNNHNYDYGSQPIVLPNGKKNSVLEVKGSDTPNVVVDKLNDLFMDPTSFTSTDKDIVDQSGAVKFKLTVEKQNATTAIGASDIVALAGNNKQIAMYLDMTLIKTLTTGAISSDIKLTSLGTLLKISIPVDLSGLKDVVIYRYHDDVAGGMTKLTYSSAVPAGEGYMIDPTGKELIIYTRNFSTYAIAYSTSTNTSEGNNGSNSSGGTTNGGLGGGGGAGGAASSSNAGYTINVAANEGGSVTPKGTLTIAAGASRTFTFTPNQGYVIADVRIDGKSVGAVSSYTFNQVTAAHTIQVVFKKEGDHQTGLPYYYNQKGKKVFIGFAAPDQAGIMKYIAPKGEEVLFQPNPKAFTDITGHWGITAIDFVTEREIFVGTSDSVFSPNKGMTRAMLATVIGRMYERSYGPLSTTGNQVFTDSHYDSWYGAYIDWSYENGIIKGIGDNKFEPDRTVTRQELAAMLYRFSQFLKLSEEIPTDGAKLTYADSSAIADWAKEAALHMQETGIISGKGNRVFAPQAVASRAEVAEMLKRFIEVQLSLNTEIGS